MRLNESAQELETIAAAAAEKDPAIEEALKAYETLPEKFRSAENMLSQIDALTPDRVPTLKPRQIDQLLAIIIQKGVVEKTGAYINHLIQDSYDAGNNNFTLHTWDAPIICLGHQLRGSIPWNGNQVLSLHVLGNVGNGFGWYAENTKMSVEGNVGRSCAMGAKHSTFHIEGNVGSYCGWYAEHINFHISDYVADHCGERAENSSFSIKGKAGAFLGSDAINCYFKTIDKEFKT